MNDEVKIVYSLNTAPLSQGRWDQGNRLKETLYMTALSILYSHLWYKDIELFVDATAFEFLHMLPCQVTLMEQPVDPDLWMKSKIYAMSKQNAPFVHLDTDVFITKKIDFGDQLCVVERREGSYETHYKQQVNFFSKCDNIPEYWNNNLGYSFNCGVFGFSNMGLKNQFVDAYYRLEQIYIRKREEFKHLKQLGYEPCIVLEQYNLACLLAANKIEPKLLLPQEKQKEQAKHALDIGYNHLFGVTKYKPNIVSEIDLQFATIFPYWYKEINQAIEGHLKSKAKKAPVFAKTLLI